MPSVLEKIRKNLLELALGGAVFALVAQLASNPVYDWLRLPASGCIGIGRIGGEPLASLQDHYYVYLPEDYAPAYTTRTAFPLVLFLHGVGERGSQLEAVRRRGLPRYLWEGEGYATAVVAPQCREKTSWRPADLAVLIDSVCDRFNIDRSRITVMGESMGGYGAWALATYAPEKLAAAVPLCGGGDVQSVQYLTELPIWAFHGEDDSVVPLSQSQSMVEAIQEKGGIATLTVLSNTGHDLGWIPFRKDVQQWVLKQRSQKKWTQEIPSS